MALHVAAQDKVKLSGRVIDDEQNPVLFAVVKVDGQAAGTTTDLQGRYQLEFSTADTVTVSFSMIGYVTKKNTGPSQRQLAAQHHPANPKHRHG